MAREPPSRRARSAPGVAPAWLSRVGGGLRAPASCGTEPGHRVEPCRVERQRVGHHRVEGLASRALRRGRCVEGVASRGVASRVLRRGRRVEVRVSSASCHVVSRRRSSRVVSRRRASHFDVAHAHSSCRDNHSNCAASPELVALQRGRRFRERYSVVPTCRRHQSRASLLDVARADSPSRDGGREHGVPRHPLAPSASMAPSTATAPSTGCALSSACLPLSRSAPARRPGGLTP